MNLVTLPSALLKKATGLLVVHPRSMLAWAKTAATVPGSALAHTRTKTRAKKFPGEALENVEGADRGAVG